MRAFISSLLFLTLAAVSAVASNSMTVSASQAIRVAWVERGARPGAMTELQRAFEPLFRVALDGIYGDSAEVEFIPLKTNRAASLLGDGQVDAVLQFSARLSRRIRESGEYVLRAESVSRPGHYVGFLVLPESSPKLQDLLANAFSASINSFDVRATLDDTLPGIEMASR